MVRPPGLFNTWGLYSAANLPVHVCITHMFVYLHAQHTAHRCDIHGMWNTWHLCDIHDMWNTWHLCDIHDMWNTWHLCDMHDMWNTWHLVFNTYRVHTGSHMCDSIKMTGVYITQIHEHMLTNVIHSTHYTTHKRHKHAFILTYMTWCTHMILMYIHMHNVCHSVPTTHLYPHILHACTHAHTYKVLLPIGIHTRHTCMFTCIATHIHVHVILIMYRPHSAQVT